MFGIKGFDIPIISSSSAVVTNMIVIGGLYDC